MIQYHCDHSDPTYFTSSNILVFEEEALRFPLEASAVVRAAAAKCISDRVNIDPIDFCIRRYVEAETDFQTLGTRGLGRAGPNPPRFGGYFRTDMERVGDASRAEIATQIGRIVAKSYYSYAFLLEVTAAENPDYDFNYTDIDREALFLQWVPFIYGAFGRTLRQFIDFADMATIDDRTAIRTTMERLQFMKKGGWFSTDHTESILIGFVAAGMSLRHVGVHV